MGLAIFNQERVALSCPCSIQHVYPSLQGSAIDYVAFPLSSGITEPLQLFIHPGLGVGTVTEVVIFVVTLSEIT